MSLELSDLEPVPDWVDKETWEEYKNYLKQGKFKKAVWILEKNLILPVTPKIHGSDLRPLNWDEIEQMVDRLANHVKLLYEPDTVIGLEKGGKIYMRRFAEIVDIDPNDPEYVTSMKVSHYRNFLGQNLFTQWIPQLYAKAKVEKVPDIDLRDRKTVILDDDTATRATLKTAKDYVENQGSEARTAALCGNRERWGKVAGFLAGYDADFCESDKAFRMYPWKQPKYLKRPAD